MKILKKARTNDVAYTFQAPNGVPGDVSRPDNSNIEPAMLIAASTVFAQSFGIPMKYVTGGIQQFNGGAETAGSFAGLLIREVPQQAATSDTGQFTGTIPNPVQPQGLLVRGYANVVCAVGTPARGGVVYAQIVASGGVPVGAFRADGTNGGNAIALTGTEVGNVTWATDGVDAGLNAEIRIAQ
jgi:hypothetical protein